MSEEGDWLYDNSANKFNNTYFRDYNNTGFAVDMSGDLVVRGQIRNDDTGKVDISGGLVVQNGNVGIGISNPRKNLDIYSDYNGILYNRSQASTARAKTFIDSLDLLSDQAVILGPGVWDNTIYWYTKSNNGSNYMYAFQNTGGFFTGQHMVYPENMNLKTNLSDHVGLIVSSSNSGYSSFYNDKLYTGKEAIRICEALPNCKLTSIEKDKSVFGVISNQENNKYFDTDGNDIYDDTKDGFEKDIKDRLRVNSVGEGAIWICNKNGNFDNGDYITSSSVPGYGVKQDDDILHNYTVAKITMSCDFNPQQVKKQKYLQDESMKESGDDDENFQRVDEVDENGNVVYQDSYEIRYLDLQGIRLTKVEYDAKLANGEQVYIAAYVGCSYHCG